jgi:hypothetical protein
MSASLDREAETLSDSRRPPHSCASANTVASLSLQIAYESRKAQRIAGKRRAEKALAKLDDAAPRVRLTGWFGLGSLEERKLMRSTFGDAGIDRICLAYRGLTPNGATRSAGRRATEATLWEA